MIKNENLFKWAEKMTTHIEHKIIKLEVQAQLYAQFEELMDSYKSRGISEEVAEKMVLDDLFGIASPTSEPLHKEESKWWGWVILYSVLFLFVTGAFIYMSYGWSQAKENKIKPNKNEIVQYTEIYSKI